MRRLQMVPLLLVVGLVMSTEAHAQLVDNNNGTVTDPRTELTWLRTIGPEGRTWQDAEAWAAALETAGSSYWRQPTAEELIDLYVMTLGGMPGGPTPDFGPFVIADVPAPIDRWTWTSSGLSPVQKIAVDLRTGTRMTYVGGSTLRAWAVKDPDADGDGIRDTIDTDPSTFSNAFASGETNGTIVDRGEQVLTVRPHPSGGVQVDAMGGSRPAVFRICNGASTIDIPAGGLTIAILRCGSAIVGVTQGSALATFYVDGWTRAKATVSAGQELTFDPEARTVTNASTSSGPVTVDINGTEQTLQPGENRSVEVAPPSSPARRWFERLVWVAMGIAIATLLAWYRRRRG